jgi:hypothetical protein
MKIGNLLIGAGILLIIALLVVPDMFTGYDTTGTIVGTALVIVGWIMNRGKKKSA